MPTSSLVRRLAAGVLLGTAACVPEIESKVTPPEYTLAGFRGPDGMPSPPQGTRGGVSLAGWWRVVRAEQTDGTAGTEHIIEPDIYIRVGGDTIQSVQGVSTSQLLPVSLDWSLNRSDLAAARFGFGFEGQQYDLRFLHYGFAMAATDGDRALATEALHYAEWTTGLPSWGIWEIELQRVPLDEPESSPEFSVPLRWRWR